ncbi:MAG: M13 family metallopeptidase [Muribaculaceae bacterium]|nr:M13 family metallopeptidase [Muribaculaceae bacterium]
MENSNSIQYRKGIDLSNLDRSYDPSDNFYKFACGGWQKNNPLPADFASYGTFSKLDDKAKNQVKSLIEGLSSHPEAKIKGTNAQKVNDLFRLGMDVERLNKEGAAPLSPFLERIGKFEDEGILNLLAWMHVGLTNSFFMTGVGPDPRDSDKNIVHLGETGLGLGDRDYYLERNEENDRILEAYKEYIFKLMRLAGYSDEESSRVRDNVIYIETELAKHKMTREQRRDPQARFNIHSLEELENKFPNFNWKEYFSLLELGPISELNILSPAYFEFINSFLPSLTSQQIKDYLSFEVVADSSNLLSEEFENVNFEMFGKVMSGMEQQHPRWRRVMTIPNSMLGEAVGALYVEKYFPPRNKEYMLKLVENLRSALAKHIDGLEWMSASTKLKALEKLDALRVKIGYPDSWRDYSGIDINPEKSYLENVYNASVWYTKYNFDKLNRKVDKAEWHMTPQTVNAYYSPSSNEICFPAAILQPPYFDPEADDALNYGAIGVIIGHEMTHGFDDQGRKFDKEGNLNNWWQEEDVQKFNALADRLVNQFDEVEVAPGVKANGKYTLGENIADQGGLRVALTALQNSSDFENTESEIDGFSRLQRFYLAYANVWAGNIRKEEVLVRTKIDPHSLGINRVNVTLKNLSPFIDAFDIREGDNMFRPEGERVVIW